MLYVLCMGRSFLTPHQGARRNFKIHQSGVQWKQGVVIYMMSCTSLL